MWLWALYILWQAPGRLSHHIKSVALDPTLFPLWKLHNSFVNQPRERQLNQDNCYKEYRKAKKCSQHSTNRVWQPRFKECRRLSLRDTPSPQRQITIKSRGQEGKKTTKNTSVACKGKESTYLPRAKHSRVTIDPLAAGTVSGKWTSILGSYSPMAPEIQTETQLCVWFFFYFILPTQIQHS